MLSLLITNYIFVMLQGFQTEADLSPNHTDMLAHIGYVPETIKMYVAHLHAGKTEQTFMNKAMSLIKQLVRDEAQQIPDQFKDVYTKSRAMISADKDISIYTADWTASSFSWYCLKSTDTYFDKVSIVSPLVKEAVVQYMLESRYI